MGARQRTTFLALFAVFALLSVGARVAAAATGATLVAVVTTDPAAPLTRRIQEQLEALGLDVIVLSPPSEGTAARARLEQVARNVGASAAIRIDPSNQSGQVWAADRPAGKAVTRDLPTPTGGVVSDASVALGAVELLSASLIELHSAESPRKEGRPAQPVSPVTVSPSSAPAALRLGLTLGIGAGLGLSGFRPSGDGDGALWVGLSPRIGLRALFSPSVAGARAQTARGEVEVTSQIYALEASYDLVDSSRTWVPVIGLGVAAARVAARGAASPPLLGAYESVWVALPVVHVGTGWAVRHAMRLRADALAGWSLSPTRVRVPDSSSSGARLMEVASWGAPLVELSLGLEVLWGPW
ncbi:MAG TPA: hypothetical protein VGY54_21370 [Polyangiaceae bacterium]|jgi:hypothetical protein|nr:hypothetical protein [Polyangiaceae bacterium]